MQDEKYDDEDDDEMPAPTAAPCGHVFETEASYVTEEDGDEMPAPDGGHCGDPFASSQIVHVTDADEV